MNKMLSLVRPVLLALAIIIVLVLIFGLVMFLMQTGKVTQTTTGYTLPDDRSIPDISSASASLISTQHETSISPKDVGHQVNEPSHVPDAQWERDTGSHE